MHASARTGLAGAGSRPREAVRALMHDLAGERIDRRGALTAGIAAGLSLASLSALAESVPGRARGGQADADALPAKVDYVIVGAGSAGCVLAHRLSADRDLRVLLLEAGGPATMPEIAVPADWPKLSGSAVDWRYADDRAVQPRRPDRALSARQGARRVECDQRARLPARPPLRL